MELQKRKPNRLKNYDYSQNGAYFITICTNKRKCILSTIDNYESRAGACSCRLPNSRLAPAEIKLTKYGKIAEEQLFLLKNRFQGIIVDKYVIMPNHIHLILIINNEQAAGASPCPTVSDVICAYKSLTTRLCKKIGLHEEKLFQTSFYDHIIRDDKDYSIKRKYIDENPLKWHDDELFCEQT